MNLSEILSVRKVVISIKDAIARRDRAALGKDIGLALLMAGLWLKGTKYAQIASFLDAETVGAIGALVASVAATVLHWPRSAASGSTGAAAGSGDQPATPADAVGAQPAQPAAPDPVQPASVNQPDNGFDSLRTGA